MLFDYRKFSLVFAVAVLLMNAMMPAAMADDDDEGKYMPRVTNAKWKSECGACHIAYPPKLLPAESWRVMMSGLDKHFGSDASLDAPDASEITDFLVQNAGGRKFTSWGKPVLRITQTRWFRKKHDDVSQRDWDNPKVKSPANCAACHSQAESGNYNEHNVRIPN